MYIFCGLKKLIMPYMPSSQRNSFCNEVRAGNDTMGQQTE